MVATGSGVEALQRIYDVRIHQRTRRHREDEVAEEKEPLFLHPIQKGARRGEAVAPSRGSLTRTLQCERPQRLPVLPLELLFNTLEFQRPPGHSPVPEDTHGRVYSGT
jgi:hypothetical protein